ncbi:hypothetical protein AKUH3B209X_PPKS00240 (plasmid) [Apilactobacillus kunkeei]|uniref:hypothetical protein n=1 Tax=Apilactobacillus waqarii TaxID=2851006 RepID=UPI0021E2F01E|nr:hypothetical protein AKUH4B403J_PPKS00240 [Apilactobacillus kunkeei]CAI2673751.1 hypothetical protein AKUH4B103J_PPKS00240 [Apilactobacillus kunkeei]CAI2674372.1 hypothetical protein AKUH4B203M_PPKS00240 [Apilactobacillus kunkeei]CAI2675801.1 hypothetical protein AKUH4B116J_PPKS00240 [Apilactobacillus kunkeei]CAI2675954.1 hypothetical protein AKUH4B303J_PPKS00240 [Apilactobacillus kunkeei]
MQLTVNIIAYLGNITVFSIINIILSSVILNVLGSSIDGILNLYVLDLQFYLSISSLLGTWFIIFILNLSILFILITLFSIIYVLGKINPKLYSIVMNNVDSKSLNTILVILNSSLTEDAPIEVYL